MGGGGGGGAIAAFFTSNARRETRGRRLFVAGELFEVRFDL
ncbi:hypothetical protein BN128_1547 [Cronobacter sakazakii 696]|nr:hypothetical protein BN128_1547 [Cronobacter sakazakii 696]